MTGSLFPLDIDGTYQRSVGIGVSSEPFLMTIIISTSCTFLTLIARQSNTLVIRPATTISGITGT